MLFGDRLAVHLVALMTEALFPPLYRLNHALKRNLAPGHAFYRHETAEKAGLAKEHNVSRDQDMGQRTRMTDGTKANHR
ncbi:MAG: hypothetical protein JJT95_14700 [Pararhodobacter sp.]|nr:hypothetical protein [Pararhodobacter sp.]